MARLGDFDDTDDGGLAHRPMVSWYFQCRGCKGPPLKQEWLGACPNCHRFYRANRVRATDTGETGAHLEIATEGEPISPAAAMQMARGSNATVRTPTGLVGFDWILDGGTLPGKTVALCGPEGAGKTSFLVKLAFRCEKTRRRFLLISSEQIEEDLALQFERFGTLPHRYVSFVHETDSDKISRLIEKEQPDICALDSIHDVDGVTDSSGFAMADGGSRAIHAMAKEIRRTSRAVGAFTILACHMNNDGTIKGGSDLRHEVDGTLILERPQAEDDLARFLRFKKYRFAPPNRRAKFLMLDNDFKDCGPLIEEKQPAVSTPKERPDLRIVPKEKE